MAEEVKDPTVLAFLWILLWSRGEWKDKSPAWPDWQRCALRRIILGGSLTDTDLDELQRICEGDCGITRNDGNEFKAVPLAKEHVPKLEGNVSISLVKLSDLRGVNRIKGVPPLEFGKSPGLSIVFGQNGAGKSGYGRVIKKACRARGAAQPIHTNVFDPKDVGPARATIEYMAGAVLTPVDWVDGGKNDPRLGNIFVFDSVSAKFHVSNDGPASFIPRGLDILPKLARGCDELKARFLKEIADAEGNIARVKANWKYHPTTKVGKLIDSVTAGIAEENFEKLAVFSEDDEVRLSELNDAMKADPRVKAAKSTAAAERVRAFKTHCSNYVVAISDARAGAIKTAIAEAKAAREAAKVTEGKKFSEKYLTGTGGAVWRRLWTIAREYAATAYPGKEYPADDARCVLCQQDLGAEAKERFRRFDEYVSNEARVAADKAEARLTELSNALDQLADLSQEHTRIQGDIAGASEEARAKLTEYVTAAEARLKHLKGCLKNVAWAEPPALKESVAMSLESIAAAYDKRSATELAAHDPTKRKAMDAERNELTDREWLSRALKDVKDQIGRFRLVAAFKRCQAQTVTNTITMRSSEIHDILVSKTFIERFDVEIKELGLITLSARMDVVGGNKGERKFGIRLVDAANAPVAEIASEGEQRCIALAAFLAELSQASHKSALVFDDPVSSLDHQRRALVARRLVKESLTRQVIVFTHDAVFLEELLDGCTEAETEPHCCHISWKGSPGHSEKGLPWEWQRYKDRLHTLGQEQRKLEKEWSPMPTPENTEAMSHAYGKFRATLERIVQDVVLCGVIARYRSWIKIELLEEVVGFSLAEYKEIRRLDRRASDNIMGHDKPVGKQQSVPTPAEFKADIEALSKLVETVKARKKPAVIGVKVPVPPVKVVKGASQN